MTYILIGAAIMFLIFLLKDKTNNKKSNTTVEIKNYSNNLKANQLIISDYIDVVSIEDEGIARKVSLLKNSKDDIKKAFAMVLPKIKKNLPKSELDKLSLVYSSLDHFVPDDEADIINDVLNQIQNGKNIEDLETEKVDLYKKMSREYSNILKKQMEFNQLLGTN